MTEEAQGAAESAAQMDTMERILTEEENSMEERQALYRGAAAIRINDAVLVERVIVVSNFRLLLLRMDEASTKRQRNLVFNAPFFDMEAIHMEPGNRITVGLKFKDDRIDIVSSQAIAILHAILFAHISITSRVSERLMPTLSIPKEFVQDFIPPQPNKETGFLATYLATCDYMEMIPKPHMIDYLIRSMRKQKQEFNLSECFTLFDKVTSLDVDIVCTSLRTCELFARFVAENLDLNDASMSIIARIFGYNKYITHLDFSNVKCGKSGIGPFVKYFRRGVHGLKYINFTSVNIGDEQLGYLVSALECAKEPLESLILRNVGMTSKGVQELVRLLSDRKWSSCLRELDISENDIGKGPSSAALASWLTQTTGLRALTLDDTGLDLDPILSSIAQNTKILNGSFATLDLISLSGNTMQVGAQVHLQSILEQSTSLSHITLSRMNLKKSSLTAVLQAVYNNAAIPGVYVDLSHNDFGPGAAERIDDVFGSELSQCITGLDMSCTGLDIQGMVELSRVMMRFIALQTLLLDGNVSSSKFSALSELGLSLGDMVLALPSLRVFSCQGEKKFALKGAVTPLVEALYENRTLLELHVGGNSLPDDTFDAILQLVRRNKCLSILGVDRNGWKMSKIRELAESLQQNETLTDRAVIPVDDVLGLYKSSSKNKAELKALVLSMEDKIRTNEENNASRPEPTSRGSQYNAGQRPSMSRAPSVALETANRSSTVISVDDTSDLDSSSSNLKLSPSARNLLQNVKPERKYSLKAIRGRRASSLPPEVDPKHREMFVSQADFNEAFGCTLEEFLDWPKWKQVRKKRELGLF